MNSTEPSVVFFVLGAVGALLPDLLRIASNRDKPDAMDFVKSGSFLVGTTILILVGLLVVYLTKPSTGVQALGCGYFGPDILTKLIAAVRGSGGGGGLGERSLKPRAFSPSSLPSFRERLLDWWSC